MIEYKGYTGAVEFDPVLRLFTGHVIDLRGEIYFEGDSVESLEASMRQAVDHYLSVCKQRGEDPERPFSGKLNLRLGSVSAAQPRLPQHKRASSYAFLRLADKLRAPQATVSFIGLLGVPSRG
jgi:predicted HicB family RNase H-like nuclease